MQQRRPPEKPRRPPAALRDLCARLEDRGIGAWSQGEGLLADLQAAEESGGERDEPAVHRATPTASGRPPTRALLCTAEPSEILRLLPGAVVTASGARRITIATPDGPVDLLPTSAASLEQTLIGFGLGAFGFAWNEASESWCDPTNARAELARGRLDLTTLEPNPFAAAPRRFWIAARLLAEYGLEPSERLLEAARAAIEPCADRLPLGAPARRELARVLFAASPARGLAFLRESGVSPRFFPGLSRKGEEIVGQLAPLPALRWAAWLRGAAIQSALVKLRVPHPLGRAVARVLRVHPIDRTVQSSREVSLRKILQRLSNEEIDGLIEWRRREIERTEDVGHGDLADPADPKEVLGRLESLAGRIEAARDQQAHAGRVRALALDGQSVMKLLDAGPGPHVGRALAHLASIVEARPEANEREVLAAELRAWAIERLDPRD